MLRYLYRSQKKLMYPEIGTLWTLLNSARSCSNSSGNSNRSNSSKISENSAKSDNITNSENWYLKSTYRWFLPVQTRWKDNDQYLHINNAVYHAIFDSVINVFLIRRLGLDTNSSSTPKGYMVTNSCSFKGSCKYPDVYLAGLAVSKIGTTSVKYQLCLFPQIQECDILLNLRSGHWPSDPVVREFAEQGLVTGESIHVFVDPVTERPLPLEPSWREGLAHLKP